MLIILWQGRLRNLTLSIASDFVVWMISKVNGQCSICVLHFIHTFDIMSHENKYFIHVRFLCIQAIVGVWSNADTCENLLLCNYRSMTEMNHSELHYPYNTVYQNPDCEMYLVCCKFRTYLKFSCDHVNLQS